MTANNQRYIFENDELLDADANGLYATSISESEFPTGIPKVFVGSVP